MESHSKMAHGQMDGTTRFSASNRYMMPYPKVTQEVKHVTEVGTTVLWDLKKAKIECSSECRAIARQRMVKWIIRQDSAHRVGLECDIQLLLR